MTTFSVTLLSGGLDSWLKLVILAGLVLLMGAFNLLIFKNSNCPTYFLLI